MSARKKAPKRKRPSDTERRLAQEAAERVAAKRRATDLILDAAKAAQETGLDPGHACVIFLAGVKWPERPRGGS